MSFRTEPVNPKVMRLVACCLLIQSAASALITYFGVADAMGGPEASFAIRAGAMMIGIAIWAMLYLIWMLAFRLVPNAGPLRVPALGIVIAASFIIIAMSTWLGAAGMAGQSAEKFHRAAAVADFEAALEARLDRAERLKSLPPVLAEAGQSYRLLAESEEKDGSITGISGPGAVAHTLARVGRELGGLSRTLSDQIEKMPSISGSAREALAGMREALDSGEPMEARKRAYDRQAVKLRGLLVQLDIEGALASVRRVVESLESVAKNQSVSARSATLAIAQQAALEKLAGQLRGPAASVNGLMDDIAGTGPGPMPRLMPMTGTEAVFAYFWQFVPFWAAAFGLDFSAFIVLLFLMLAHQRRELDAEVSPNLKEITVDDLLAAQGAAALLEADEKRRSLPLPNKPKRGRPRKQPTE